MSPEQYQRLLARLSSVRNTDELLDVELSFAPLDEDDPLAQRALFELACRRCHLARGPAPLQARFALRVPRSASVRHCVELRGRMGSRIVRVGWADGTLFGSRYAIVRLQRALGGARDVAEAERIIRSRMASVIEPVAASAVA